MNGLRKIALLNIAVLAGCLGWMGCLPIPVPGREQISPGIRGRVLDMQTGEPVAGARVQIHEHPKTCVLSDATGEFRVGEGRRFFLMTFVTGQNVYHFPPVQRRSYLFDVSHPDYNQRHLHGLREYLKWEHTNDSSELVVRDVLLVPKNK